MPLYECYCEPCELTFEALAPLSAAGAPSHPCPRCGAAARRILSAVVFGRRAAAEPVAPAPGGRPDVTRLRVPGPAQICWMDGPSKARYAAYLNGRGREYDEVVAARAEKARDREPSAAPAAPTSEHHHEQSPLADPAVYARRRAAAERANSDPSK